MSDVPVLDFPNTNFKPGSARYGNFINYYSFNSVEIRIGAIPVGLLQELSTGNGNIVCLDVGCNSGELTIALYSHLKTACKNLGSRLFIIGVDLDEILITRCKERNPYPTNVSFHHLDVMSKDSSQILDECLKLHNKDNFDLVTCFSVTMWIHLNYGDRGLLDFLTNLCSITKLILIEPQEWKCYRAAVRRNKRLKCHSFNLENIKVKDVSKCIENVCAENGLEKDKYQGETSWGRKLYFYKKIKSV